MSRGYHGNAAVMQTSDMVVTLPRENSLISPLLYDYLVTATPYRHEDRLVKLLPFLNDKDLEIVKDEVGNIIVYVGKFRHDHRTVFSCHMDTQHYPADVDKKLELCVTIANSADDGKNTDYKEGMIYSRYKFHSKHSNTVSWVPAILGADDKLGCYIMTRMIEKRIPGMYVFHIGEEKGSIGSKHIKEKTPKIFKGMRRAIAFDRKEYTDIVSFQAGGKRGCSTTFATALAAELNKNMPPFSQYQPDIRGVWTDTANYFYIIPECTNISVGYFDEHQTCEHFDAVWFNSVLLPAVLKVDWEKLPIERDKVKAKEEDEKPYQNNTPPYKYKGTKVTLDKATASTSLYDMPDWDPSMGLQDCTPEIMKRLCLAWTTRKAFSEPNSATQLYELVVENAKLKGEIAALKNVEQKVLPFRPNGSFSDPKVKQERIATKCKIMSIASALWWREVTAERIQGIDEHDNGRIERLSETVSIMGAQLLQMKKDGERTAPILEYQFNKNMFDFAMRAPTYRYCNTAYANAVDDVLRYIMRNSDEPVFIDFKPVLKDIKQHNLPVIVGGDMNKGG
jgi:hypothetical protein